MKPERTPSMRMIPAFRCTWLLGVILLLSAATGWAQAGNVSTAAQQDVTRPRTSQGLPGPTDDLLAKLESIYKDIHANPELSMQEQRTAGIAAGWLRQYGYEVTEKVGGTGVVGLLRNGEGEGRFGSNVQQGSPATASEDFSIFARTWNVPSVFCDDPDSRAGSLL